MRQETDGVLLECYLIYEPEHMATWFKDGEILLGALDFDEKYQVGPCYTLNNMYNLKNIFKIAAFFGKTRRLDILRIGN